MTVRYAYTTDERPTTAAAVLVDEGGDAWLLGITTAVLTVSSVVFYHQDELPAVAADALDIDQWETPRPTPPTPISDVWREADDLPIISVIAVVDVDAWSIPSSVPFTPNVSVWTDTDDRIPTAGLIDESDWQYSYTQSIKPALSPVSADDEVTTPPVLFQVDDDYWQYFTPLTVSPQTTVWVIDDEIFQQPVTPPAASVRRLAWVGSSYTPI
jgi:hypothetical protein